MSSSIFFLKKILHSSIQVMYYLIAVACYIVAYYKNWMRGKKNLQNDKLNGI